MFDWQKLKLTESGLVPVKKWNALVDTIRRSTVTSLSGGSLHVTDGGTSLVIPPRFGGGGNSASQPFELSVEMSAGETPTPMIRVIPSTLAGGSSEDLGFSSGDDPHYLLAPSEGVLIGGISWEPTTGVIGTRWLEIQATFPDPETVADGTDYVEIGTVHWVDDESDAGGHWKVTNSRYGPIDATICRNWFATEAPYFSASFFTWSSYYGG